MSHVQVDIEKLNLNRFSDEDTKAKVVKLVLDINCRLDMSPPYLQQFWKNVLAYFQYMPEQHAVGFLQDQMNCYFLSPLSHGHLSGSMEVQPSHGSYLGQQFVSSDRAQRWGRGAPSQHQSWGMMAGSTPACGFHAGPWHTQSQSYQPDFHAFRNVGAGAIPATVVNRDPHNALGKRGRDQAKSGFIEQSATRINDCMSHTRNMLKKLAGIHQNKQGNALQEGFARAASQAESQGWLRSLQRALESQGTTKVGGLFRTRDLISSLPGMVDAPKGNVELLHLAFRHWFQFGYKEGEKPMACAVCTSNTLIDEQMVCVGPMRTLNRALNKGPPARSRSGTQVRWGPAGRNGDNLQPKWFGFFHKEKCDCLKETSRAAAAAAAAAVSSDGCEHGDGGGAGSADGADSGEAGQVDAAAAAASSESGEHGDGGGTGRLAAPPADDETARAAAAAAAAAAVSSQGGEHGDGRGAGSADGADSGEAGQVDTAAAAAAAAASPESGVHGDGGGTGGLAAPPADDNAAAQDGSAASLRTSDLEKNVVVSVLDSNRGNVDFKTPMKFELIAETDHNPGSTRLAKDAKDAQAVAPYARITGQILNGTHVAADIYRIRGNGSCLAITLLLSIFFAHQADQKLVQQLQENSQAVWLAFAKFGQDLSKGKDLLCFAFREWIYLSTLLNSLGFRDRLETPRQPELNILPLARATAAKAGVSDDVFNEGSKCAKCMYAASFLDTSVYIEEPILRALFEGPLKGVGLMVFETHGKGRKVQDAFFNSVSSINLEAAILIPILFENRVADACRKTSKARSTGEAMLGSLAARSLRSAVNKAAPSEEELVRQLAVITYNTDSKKNHFNRLVFQGGKHVLCRNDLPNRCLLPSRVPCLLPSLPPSLAPSLVRSTSSVSTLAPSLCPHMIPSLSFPRALQASIPRSLALSLPCNLPSSCFIACGGIPSLRLFAAACGRRDLDS